MIAFLIALFLLLTPGITSAQIIPVLESPVEIQITPQSPNPGDSVLVTTQNAPTTGEVSYEWRVDGLLYDQGVGRNKINLTVGNVGDNMSVSLSVFLNGDLYAQKERFIRPAEVDLIWEGDTYTPPFYFGLPLPNRESNITFLAVPNIVEGGVRVGSNNLNYSWYINNSRTPIKRGNGLSSIKIKVPSLGEPFTMTIAVNTNDNLIEVKKTISITPTDPKVLIYEVTPLLGIRFDKAITNNFNLTNEEVSLIGVPLFSSPLINIEFTWTIDGKKIISTGKTEREITLRKESSGQGRFNVNASFQNINTLFERASKNFLLTF